MWAKSWVVLTAVQLRKIMFSIFRDAQYLGVECHDAFDFKIFQKKQMKQTWQKK